MHTPPDHASRTAALRKILVMRDDYRASVAHSSEKVDTYKHRYSGALSLAKAANLITADEICELLPDRIDLPLTPELLSTLGSLGIDPDDP